MFLKSIHHCSLAYQISSKPKWQRGRVKYYSTDSKVLMESWKIEVWHTTLGTCRTGSDGFLILVIDFVWFMENLSIRLNSPLNFNPCALTLDLWEKQERRVCLEKPYTTAAAKASGRFNTCLVQKGSARFGITEVDGGIGLHFQRHPPCDCDRCRMQAKIPFNFT